MNNTEAKRIAETITNTELLEMFRAAKANIENWDAVSNVNKIMSKGTAWNILAAKFDVNQKYPYLAIKNMVWEFGDFLPDRFKKPKSQKVKVELKAIQTPNFDNPLFQ